MSELGQRVEHIDRRLGAVERSVAALEAQRKEMIEVHLPDIKTRVDKVEQSVMCSAAKTNRLLGMIAAVAALAPFLAKLVG